MIRCVIKVGDIMFPKDKPIESGDFAIFRGEVVKHISGDKPKIHPFFRTISIKGNVPHIRKGDTFTMILQEGETNSYGTTYIVKSVIKEIDKTDPKQVKEYLIIMCGNKVAAELLKLDNPYDLLETRNVEELLKVKGIGEKRLEQIFNNIERYSDYSLAYVELIPLGLTEALVRKICLNLGGAATAIEVCKSKPYMLIDKVPGIGFIAADQIAMKCGLNPSSDERIRYGIMHTMSELGENGKSFLTSQQLLVELNRLLNIPLYNIDGIINSLIKEELICISSDGTQVALTKFVKLEQNIAKELIRIRDAESKIEIPEDWREQVTNIENEQGWCYTEEQLYGIEQSLINNILVVSGKAGSGKSSVTNAMTKIIDNYSIEMCCLSAKAAQRLSEVSGREAQTIHRLLNLGFDIGEDIPELYADVIILDEASMVSGTLFLKLLRAIPSGAKLIILGDDGQLTAIGNCAVFSDIMKSKVIPHVELTKIHRQAKKSAIITESIAIRNQQPIYEKGFIGHRVLGELQDLELFVENESYNLIKLVKDKFIEDLQKTGNVLEVQVISALKTRGDLSIHNINLELQRIYNPTPNGESISGKNKVQIYVGDKVINLKNNYKTKTVDGKKKPIFNGSIGIVKKIEPKQMIINFIGVGDIVVERDNFESINLAYAISCHSSQGSQWKNVICAFDMSGYVLLNVELLYTALTRAEEHCSLIIESKAMQHALRTVEQKTKQTLLPSFLCL